MFEQFTQSALRRKTEISIDFGNLATLITELNDAQKAAYPEADMGKIIGQLEDAFVFTCPNCGQLKSSAVLMGAMVKSMQGMNPGMATIFGGPNIANLASGRCPGCNGARLNVAYDPHRIQGIGTLPDASGKKGNVGIFGRGAGALAALARAVFGAAGGRTKGGDSDATAAAVLEKEITVGLGGGVKMAMVLIPAGEFMMGSEKGKADEKPVHVVRITKPFYIGKYEVTQKEWQAVMGTNPSCFKRAFFRAKNPVERVSWTDCQDFVRKVSEKVAGGGLRLPTEAEWEYACRGGTTTEYFFGDSGRALGEYAWWEEDITTHPIGQKKPNAWGLYDMHGNVLEWCEDWYGDKYYAESPADDPQGPSSGALRVLRGGSWLSVGAGMFRCAVRYYAAPTRRINDNGFRCARTL